MPAKSKISSKPSAKAVSVDERTEFYCCRCPRSFRKQKTNFPASQSPLYKANNHYLPICRHCMDDLYQHYKSVLDTPEEAIKRLCQKWDIYWSPDIYAILSKANTSQSRILAYISKSNLYQYSGKTYDDTIDAEQAAALAAAEETKPVSHISETVIDDLGLSADSVQFWGAGFLPEDYFELDYAFQKWRTGYECKTIAEENLLKQIVLTDWRITKETQRGNKTDGLINAYNALLGSANLKPVQNKESTLADQDHTMGTLIKMWEHERPIPEPAPEWQDVDGIVRYISIWFLGHLCKMMRINNTYSRLYDAEMAKYRVERPEYDGEDEEMIFDDVFGGGSNAN